MRYAVMQLLTWGTIASAVGSALLLAALDSPALRFAAERPVVMLPPSEPTPAAAARAAPHPGPAASAAPKAGR